MNKLTAEQIQSNWDKLISIIEDTFSGERKQKLLKMYDHFQDRMILAPASGKEHYHNAFPGGYVEHVLHIIDFSKQIYEMWKTNGAHINFTDEELIFSAMHHDLGKAGDLNLDYYVPQDNDWFTKNRGEIYKLNPDLQYMRVPDRGLWILQHYGIRVTDKEYIGIKLTDGIYDEANKAYYIAYDPNFQLRSNLSYILHQADMMATRIEYDNWKHDQEDEEEKTVSGHEKETVDKMKKAFDELFV